MLPTICDDHLLQANKICWVPVVLDRSTILNVSTSSDKPWQAKFIVQTDMTNLSRNSEDYHPRRHHQVVISFTGSYSSSRGYWKPADTMKSHYGTLGESHGARRQQLGRGWLANVVESTWRSKNRNPRWDMWLVLDYSPFWNTYQPFLSAYPERPQFILSN